MSTVREKAPSILTPVGARRLTARIRDALAVADDLLARAYEGRVWEALGHESWAVWCAAELPELSHVKLRAPQRRERVAKLRHEGATIPDIVAATGSSLGTIHRDLQALEGGHTRPATSAPVVESRADQVVRLVAESGAQGMTVRELCARARIHHGAASGALSRVHRQGRVVRTEVYRDECAVYAVPA